MRVRAKRETTSLLRAVADGDSSASDQLLPIVYDELHAIAESFFNRERANHTLQPTALVHEAYIRLIEQDGAVWTDRAHFLSLGAKMIRRVLIDHARKHRALKRGGGQGRITLSGLPADAESDALDLLALDEALTRLWELDARQAQVVEFKFLAGMTDGEVALVLGVTDRTIRGDWSHARAGLSVNLPRGIRNDP